MFETLLDCCIAYFRAHPDEHDVIGSADVVEGLAQAARLTEWTLVTPPWNLPAIARRLDAETQRLHEGSNDERHAFFTAKRAALVQLQHGEHG